MSPNHVRIFPAFVRTRIRGRPLVSIVGLGLAAAWLLACSAIPPVSPEPPGQVHTIRAETPHEWSRRTVACTDARKRARINAESECDLAQISAGRDACTCHRDAAAGGGWVCSAEAAYVCVAGR